MTILVLGTDIPSNINTLERLHAWSGFALAFLNPTLAVLETPNSPQKVAQSQIFQATDNTNRLLVRATLVLPDDYVSDRTIKLWMRTLEFSNVALPAAFKVN